MSSTHSLTENARDVQDWQNGGFGLYIHWPFCAAKCPYCDFNSHVRAKIDHKAWQTAFINELKQHAPDLSHRALNSIYFGGGTPSLMEPETVAAIIETAHEIWPVSNELEVTLEANPTSVEARKFKEFATSGVNRVSVGIQALRDADLKALGRLHSAQEALDAYTVARSIFNRVSLDLIYARQSQTLAEWETELSEALALQPDHLSLYQLTIEQGTRFGALYNRGLLKNLPSDGLSADMYEMTGELCDAAGLAGYEVSNYARLGQESRHNLIYWRYGDYLGIGPGAHGRITKGESRFSTQTVLAPEEWLRNQNRQMTTEISAIEQAEEYLMMSLRLNEGCDMTRYATLSGQQIPDQKINELVDDELLVRKGSRICATRRGRMVLNSVLSHLLT